jgi:hypothetical protein
MESYQHTCENIRQKEKEIKSSPEENHLTSDILDFFDSYRMAVEEAYNNFLAEAGNTIPAEAHPDIVLQRHLQAQYEKWLQTAFEKLGGRTPAAYLQTIGDLEALIEMFSEGAVICDDGLPEIFLDKIKAFGEKAVDALAETAAQAVRCEPGSDLSAPLMAVRVLGEWKAERAAAPMIGMLAAEGESAEQICESVRDALICMGNPAVSYIIDALDSEKFPQSSSDYLLMALSEIGRKDRSDRIYQRLKKAFLELSDKLTAASCLAVYGDGRAVPALRNCLLRMGQSMERDEFFEIVSAIKKLGGRIDDLKLPNRQ